MWSHSFSTQNNSVFIYIFIFVILTNRFTNLLTIGTRAGQMFDLDLCNLPRIKLVSHWHANFSRLFCEFCRGTFARHSCECRASVVRIFCVAN